MPSTYTAEAALSVTTCVACTSSPTPCGQGRLWPHYVGPCLRCARETLTSSACGWPHCRDCRAPAEPPAVETDQQVWARIYSFAGYKIFPLWPIKDGACTCRRGAQCPSPGKHPLYDPAHRDEHDPLHGKCKYGGCGRVGHGLYDATDDPAINEQRWRAAPHAGIGFPAQGNGKTIIDVDPRKGGDRSFRKLLTRCFDFDVDLTQTVAQITGDHDGERGTHYLFTAPPDGFKGGADKFGADLPGIDVRGTGHYIVVAPTLHVSGVHYEWINFTAAIAPWPDILTRLAYPPRPPTSPPPAFTGGGDTHRYVRAAVAREVNKVSSAPEGQRNDTLNESAYYLGKYVAGGVLDLREATEALTGAAHAAGLTGSETAATIASGLAGGAGKPRTGPAPR